jgi:hypothetical protein
VRQHSGFRDVKAWCATCGWESQAKNAHGNAARHHDATGHIVHVEIMQYVIYGAVKKS